MNGPSQDAPGEQPVVQEPSAAGSAELQSGDDTQSPTLAELSHDDLLAVLREVENPGESRLQEPPADEPAAQEPPAGEQPQDDPPADPEAGTPTDPSPTGKAPQRLSVRSLPVDEQVRLASALDLVRRGDAPNMLEALRQVSGEPSAPAAASDATPAEVTETNTPVQQSPSSTQEIQTRIKDLRAQRRDAKANYDTDKEIELTEAIEDAQFELLKAEQSAAQQQVAQRSYQEQYQTSVDAMEAKYPEANDESSAFYRVLDDRVAAAVLRQDPALNDPNYIIKFADEVAADLGMKKQAATPPTAPARPSRPAGSTLAPGHGSQPRPNPDQVRELIKTVPIEVLQQVAFRS